MANTIRSRIGLAVPSFRAEVDLAAVATGVEVAGILGFLLTYIWLIDPLLRGQPRWWVYVTFLGCMTVSHVVRGESLRDLGFRFDTLRRSCTEAFIMIAPAMLVVYATGLFLGETRHMSPRNFVISVLWVSPWALFQQYGLLAVLGRRLRLLTSRPVVVDVGCGVMFALLHLPNPLLTSVTFGAGYCCSVLYRRSPNLFALALAHALLSATLHHSLPVSITLSMSVGPGCVLKMITG
jgi:membrane protease YdiL (CAAX protease family)